MNRFVQLLSMLLSVALSLGLLVSCASPSEEPMGESETESETTVVSVEESSDSLTDTETVSEGVSIVHIDRAASYCVVIPAGANDTEQRLAVCIADKIETITGESPEITYDDVMAYRENANCILIGAVDYPEVKAVLGELSREQYGIRYVGSKLVVAGHTERTLEMAGELFLEMMDISANSDTESIVLYVSDEWIEKETTMLLNFPDCKYGTKQVDIDNENGTLMLSYMGVKAEEFDSYRGEVEALGYDLWQSNEIVENRFATYRSEEGEIHLSYYPALSGGTMHIFTNGFRATSPIPDAEPYEKITEAALYNISFDYSNKSVEDGYGMCYVVELEDGRFIVMDGGNYESSGSHAHERIYRCLSENNKRADGRIIIAAWFISHPHVDHYGAVESFFNHYTNDVTLEYVIANPYSTEMTTDGASHWMLTTLPSILTKTRAKLIKPHAGQVLTFCNTELEVMFTHENLYPAKLNDANNASTVLRMHQNEHTALFTGDICTSACNRMVKLYGEAMKSEIFQVNHHGHSGGTWGLYEMATYEDSYVLWTCPEEFFYYRTLGTFVEGKSIVDKSMLQINRDLALKVGFHRNFYAEGAVEKFLFPKDGKITLVGERDVTLDPTTYTLPNA